MLSTLNQRGEYKEIESWDGVCKYDICCQSKAILYYQLVVTGQSMKDESTPYFQSSLCAMMRKRCSGSTSVFSDKR